jgi:hypothetical protein
MPEKSEPIKIDKKARPAYGRSHRRRRECEMTTQIGGNHPADRVAGGSSLDWVELEQLSVHIDKLQNRYRTERATTRSSATAAIERELVESMSLRQRLIGRLCDHLANQVVAS